MIPLYINLKVISGNGGNIVNLQNGYFIKNIRKVELYEWKVTGLSGDPNGSLAYSDDVLYLDFEGFDNRYSFMSNTNIRSDNKAKTVVTLNLPKPQVLINPGGSTIVTPGEVSVQFAHPIPISYFPRGDGSMGNFKVNLSRDTNQTGTLSLSTATFSNLYLWLVVWVDDFKTV